MQAFNTLNIRGNLREYAGFIRHYKPAVIILLVAVFIVELNNIIPRYLFKVIVDKATLYTSQELTRNAFVKALLIIATIYFATTLINTFCRWLELHLLHKIETGIIYDLKTKYFNHIVHLSHNFHTTHKTGSLISKIVRGGSAIERLSDVFAFNVFPLLFQIILVGSSLLYFDAFSAVVVFLMMILFIGYSIYLQARQEEHNINANTQEDREKAFISDIFLNIDSIKYFGKEKHITHVFSLIGRKTHDAFLRFWSYFGAISAGQLLIVNLGLLTIMWSTLTKFLNGTMTLGTLVFVYTIYGSIVNPMFNFVHGIRNFHRAMADLDPLFAYGRIHNDITDKPRAKDLTITRGEIQFNDVTFTYHNKTLFDHFNLRITPKTKVALVGHSGSGKTTLVKLLYRLYDVNAGSILIDGKNIQDYQQESLRSNLSIVPQECILFDDTIYNNIAFSNPKASRARVMQVIKFAQLDKTIDTLPNKEHTIVGERGVRLSGGEKQRVSIARALLANKKILILDEATSSLDSATEHEIQKSLHTLMKNRTTLIIAHRLSTIIQADHIIVLDKGKIVQAGTHKQLITQHGKYRQLWNLQKGGYIK